jgi:phosphoglycerate kinase
LLENTRFYPGEEAKDAAESDAFAAQVAPNGLYDVYVNDAFGTSHRKNASMWAVAKRIPVRVAGFLVEKEAVQLTKVYEAPQEGFIVVLGGAKVSDKIGVIKSLLPKAERMLIGGAMSWAFFKAKRMEIGESLCDDESVASANEILTTMADCLDKLVLPIDVHMLNKADESEKEQVPADQIKPGWDALDIGPETAKMYSDFVLAAKTVFWNGPMGYFEKPPFDAGTLAVAKAMGDCPGFNVVGGGDSVAAVTQMGIADKIDHVSTGGGASLELLEFGHLPGIDVLDDK